MQKIKRGLASLLVAVMLITALPVTALAAEAPPEPAAAEEPETVPGADAVPEEETEEAEAPEAPEAPAEVPEEAPAPEETEAPEESDAPDEQQPSVPDAEPDGNNGVSPFSLLPLEEEYLTVDLTGRLWGELKAVKLRELLADANLTGDPVVSWAENYSDNFTTGNLDSTIDLTVNGRYGGNAYLQIIVGTADQLDPDNTRYIVRAKFSSIHDMFTFETYTEEREELRVFYSIYQDYDEEFGDFFHLGVDPVWQKDTSNWLGVKFSDTAWDDVDVTVYEGYYDTEDAALAAGAKDITGQIWNQTDLSQSGGYLADYSNREQLPQFTFVLKRGEITDVMPASVWMSSAGLSLHYKNNIYAAVGEERRYAGGIANYDGDTLLYRLYDDYPANGTYYINLECYNPDPEAEEAGENGIQYVMKAVEGEYFTLEEAAAAPDIKEQLFSDASKHGGGYGADYSNGVTFTIFATNNTGFHLTVKTTDEGQGNPPPAPTPLSPDTYFRMMRAYDEFGVPYDCSYIEYDQDSYYYNGYQTVFLLDLAAPDYDTAAPVADGTEIYPYFYSGNKVRIFAGEQSEVGAPVTSAVEQFNRVTPVTLHSGQPIRYSAAAEDGINLKNYWITFVTLHTGGAELFVNAATNADPLLLDKGEDHPEDKGLPRREVFLDHRYDYHHDVLIANTGDEPLTGLQVTLAGAADGTGEAQNVKLDEYWTIGEGTRELAAFGLDRDRTPSGSFTAYGAGANMAKIRLLPVTDANGKILTGDISGYLIIKSSNGGEVTIRITGQASVPEIITDSLLDGVKYVPYSSLIQTSNMYDDAVTFSLAAGPLPDGLILKPNGEIYGVPQVTGSYPITVQAKFSNGQVQERSYTLVIADNTDSNVWNATDTDYTVTHTVGLQTGADHFVWTSGDGVFTTNGNYRYFLDFYLNGRKLTRGVDYDAEEGSTVITIRAQTLGNEGTGTHTLAAEFREGDRDNGTLKRAAQNYTIEVTRPGSSGSGSGGGNTSGGGTPSTKPDTTQKPSDQTPSNQTPSNQTQQNTQPTQNPPSTPSTGMPFTDVLPASWFLPDVKWAYDQSLMTGVSENSFSPGTAISQATIVTILARLGKVDLTPFEAMTDETIESGKWFTSAAIWAKQAGLLPDYSTFTGEEPITREGMAVMLVKYLRRMGKDTTPPAESAVFADAEQMSQSGSEAFQVLYHYNIFKGVGDNRMDPAGTTTRAQFAALIHRISDTL